MTGNDIVVEELKTHSRVIKDRRPVVQPITMMSCSYQVCLDAWMFKEFLSAIRQGFSNIRACYVDLDAPIAALSFDTLQLMAPCTNLSYTSYFLRSADSSSFLKTQPLNLASLKNQLKKLDL